MLEKIKQDKLNSGEIGMENVDEIELPAEEKSIRWKRAVIGYSLSTTLVLASPIMYLIFSESMWSGEVCKFYMLSGAGDEETCLKNYSTDPETYNAGAGFRL